MIQEIFLRRAYNIKKRYNSIVRGIDSYENSLKNLLSTLESKQEDFIGLKERLDLNKFDDPEKAKNEFLNLLIELESEVNGSEIQANSIDKQIESLRKEEIDLHREIKQRYPELRDDEIKKEIYEYLNKMNLS
jgi:hypothetical protein